MAEEKSEKAGVFALICSFLIPLIGIICYFVNKNKVENASSYLFICCIRWFFGRIYIAFISCLSLILFLVE